MSFSHAIHESKKLPEFQLLQLEEDLVRIFVAGKPLIESPSSIRILFKFKQSQKPANIITDEYVLCVICLIVPSAIDSLLSFEHICIHTVGTLSRFSLYMQQHNACIQLNSY